jgi:hypothetical protein
LLALMSVVAWGPGVGAQTVDSVRAARARLWVPPVASLLVPGVGQLLTKRDRGLAYLAAEGYVLSRFVQLSLGARRSARRYRDLAFSVARRGFAAARRDTVFEYYEMMEKFTASGEFDLDPGSGLIPEPDPSTYNGSVWLLARRTFWADPETAPPPTSPEFRASLKFYTDHAVGPDFRWSWQNASLEQQEFSATIRSSDDTFRRAQSQLGLLLANHLTSAIDALISTRLSSGLRRSAEVQTLWGGRRGSSIRVQVAF